MSTSSTKAPSPPACPTWFAALKVVLWPFGRRTHAAAEPHPVAELRRFIDTVHTMKLYAASEGLVIPPETQGHITALIPFEKGFPLADGEDSSSMEIVKALPVAMAAHAGLSRVVAPATPDSIEYTRPVSGFFDFAERQTLIFFLVSTALFAMIMYLVFIVLPSTLIVSTPEMRTLCSAIDAFTDRADELHDALTDDTFDQDLVNHHRTMLNILSEVVGRAESAVNQSNRQWSTWQMFTLLKDPEDRGGVPEWHRKLHEAIGKYRGANRLVSPSDVWWQIVFDQAKVVFAAMLGAAFYTLYTAHRYMVDRTFDRNYSLHYIVRLILGIVAGVILANFGPEIFGTSDPATSSERAIQTLTVTLLALLGGYSADAVNSILTRVAETLQTVVAGSGRDQAKREIELAKMQAETDVKASEDAAKQETLSRLNQLLVKATETADQQLIADIKAQIKDLAGE